MLFEIKKCKEGEVICRQGEVGNGFYVILEGRYVQHGSLIVLVLVYALGRAGRGMP
jgi:hypothetical protein